MAFIGKNPARSKVDRYDKPTQQVSHFNYLVYITSVF
jgi:hypothetical protein